MPYDDPEPDDPHMLVGVALPGDERVTREMAEAFADEFAQLGLDRDRILALYRDPFYAGAHAALRAMGEATVSHIVDESVTVWGKCRVVVNDACGAGEGVGPLVGRNGLLKILR